MSDRATVLGGITGRARSRSSFVGPPERSAIGEDACGPCPSCGTRTRRVSHKLVGRRTARAAHNGPQAVRICQEEQKDEERRPKSNYNDARLSRRLTRLTSRASLRSDHDHWTA